MNYVSGILFNQKALDGKIRIPKGSTLTLDKDYLFYNGKKICFKKSQNAFDFFARNDDGNGKQRFALTHEILVLIANMRKEYEQAVANALKGFEKDEEGNYPQEAQDVISAIENKPQAFFDAVHADPVFKHYLNNGYWCFEFFNAEIADLERLKALIG